MITRVEPSPLELSKLQADAYRYSAEFHQSCGRPLEADELAAGLDISLADA